MTRNIVLRSIVLLALALGMTLSADAQDRTRPAANPPRLFAVAETNLVMEGVAHANYQGLERNLKQRPADLDAWTFVRGQALLVAESGNLMMIRPPRNAGETAWMQRSADLRDSATTLARHAGNRDYERSKLALLEVANTCNRCHQTFRVPTQIGPPPGEKNERKVERAAE